MQLLEQLGETIGAQAHIKMLFAHFLALCAALVIFPRQSPAQSFPDTLPAWYSNGASGGLIQTLQDPPLSINWRNSYIFQGPNNAALYWYVQVEFRNIGSTPRQVSCEGRTDPKKFLELMSGTQNAGYVAADQTFCQTTPNFKRVIEPEGAYYEWAIFHNVPWKAANSSVSIGWLVPGNSTPVFSAPVNPWSSPISVTIDPQVSATRVPLPAPAECPPELTKLKTCTAGQPQGNKVLLSNLIVIVHGCCTNNTTDLAEFQALADTMIGEIIRNRKDRFIGSRIWEVVVWSWDTPKPQSVDLGSYFIPAVFFLADPLLSTLELDSTIDSAISNFLADATTAYNNAKASGGQLAQAILAADGRFSTNAQTKGYVNIHLIGHSAGAKLIDVAAKALATKYSTLPQGERPFIHLTFLDAYTPQSVDTTSYGSLPGYADAAHFSEHYVDKNLLLPHTNSNLTNAYNFDITDFSTSARVNCLGGFFDQARDCPFGHMWPLYWYEKSVTAGWYLSGFKYGYPFSREGGDADAAASNTISLQTLSTIFPPGQCEQLTGVGETPIPGCTYVP